MATQYIVSVILKSDENKIVEPDYAVRSYEDAHKHFIKQSLLYMPDEAIINEQPDGVSLTCDHKGSDYKVELNAY
jgi:hypothetical protein